MRHLFSALLLGVAASALPTGARADFTLVPGTSVPRPEQGPGSGPIVLNPVSSEARPKAAPELLVPIARGFGEQVPLAFATRQIVPAQVKVTFGPNVDQAAVVTWAGGRPWHETLRTAVRPLGLRVVIGWKTVAIVAG